MHDGNNVHCYLWYWWRSRLSLDFTRLNLLSCFSLLCYECLSFYKSENLFHTSRKSHIGMERKLSVSKKHKGPVVCQILEVPIVTGLGHDGAVSISCGGAQWLPKLFDRNIIIHYKSKLENFRKYIHEGLTHDHSCVKKQVKIPYYIYNIMLW